MSGLRQISAQGLPEVTVAIWSGLPCWGLREQAGPGSHEPSALLLGSGDTCWLPLADQDLESPQVDPAILFALCGCSGAFMLSAGACSAHLVGRVSWGHGLRSLGDHASCPSLRCTRDAGLGPGPVCTCQGALVWLW